MNDNYLLSKYYLIFKNNASYELKLPRCLICCVPGCACYFSYSICTSYISYFVSFVTFWY